MNKRHSKNEWQRLIDEQAASGLTQKAFCAQAGIAVATFGYWKRKLRDEGARHSDEPMNRRIIASRKSPPGWRDSSETVSRIPGAIQ